MAIYDFPPFFRIDVELPYSFRPMGLRRPKWKAMKDHCKLETITSLLVYPSHGLFGFIVMLKIT